MGLGGMPIVPFGSLKTVKVLEFVKIIPGLEKFLIFVKTLTLKSTLK